MFKHKLPNGRRNICGEKVSVLRKNLSPKVSQRKLADIMQLKGLDMDKTAIRRIENGERYVTDIELQKLCEIFNITADDFINYTVNSK